MTDYEFGPIIRQRIQESVDVKSQLLADPILINQIGELSAACADTLKAGGKLIFAGNGGSFADAQHIATEFTSRFMFDRPPLAAVALGTNASAISAMGNDYGFDLVFARELAAIANSGDLFIPITTSGNSPNIIRAVEVANSLGIRTIALTGNKKCLIEELCDCIRVPSSATPRIQESHILIGHIVSEIVEATMFEANAQ